MCHGHALSIPALLSVRQGKVSKKALGQHNVIPCKQLQSASEHLSSLLRRIQTQNETQPLNFGAEPRIHTFVTRTMRISAIQPRHETVPETREPPPKKFSTESILGITNHNLIHKQQSASTALQRFAMSSKKSVRLRYKSAITTRSD